MEQDQVLKGKRILVTRPIRQAKMLSNEIKRYGGVAVEVPLIAIVAPTDRNHVREVLRKLDSYTWLVLTSTNGVEQFFTHYRQCYGETWNKQNRPQIAVVGKKTHQALEKFGVEASLVPNVFSSEGLVDVLRHKITKADHILIARGNIGRQTVEAYLIANEIPFTDLIVYETSKNLESNRVLQQQFHKKRVDMITFTSPSAVHHFVAIIQESRLENEISSIPIACIGPNTAEAVISYHLPVSLIPSEYTIESLMKAIVMYFNRGA